MIYKSANFFQKIYNYAIALIRKQSGSTSMGFLSVLLETIFNFIMIMFIMLLIRGSLAHTSLAPFGLYILTGVAPYMIHTQVVRAIAIQSDKGAAALMPLLSVNRGILIAGNVLQRIYLNFIVTLLFFVGCYAWYGGLPDIQWTGVFLVMVITLLWSISFGMIFLALMPLAPKFIKTLIQVYIRLSMVTSGKMIVGNKLALMGRFGGLFVFNPLFHCIDQLRGFVFVSTYNPQFSNLYFPAEMAVIFFCISIMLTVLFKNKS